MSKRGGSATEKKAVLALCRECCVTHSALLLQGYFGPINIPTKNDDRYEQEYSWYECIIYYNYVD